MAGSRHAEVRLAALAPLLRDIDADGLDWLSGDERTRLNSMRSETRRKQFLAGHWLARDVASAMLGGSRHDWLLASSPDGTSSLRSSGYDAGQAIPATLSHSADMVAAAMAAFPVGIDLECAAKPRHFLALADAVFCPEECADLRRASDHERPRLFYLYWTLKEAVGKRAGHGLRPELARRQRSIECAAAEADVVSWQLSECSLALAGEIGMTVRASGVPGAARQRFWRIESVAG